MGMQLGAGSPATVRGCLLVPEDAFLWKGRNFGLNLTNR